MVRSILNLFIFNKDLTLFLLAIYLNVRWVRVSEPLLNKQFLSIHENDEVGFYYYSYFILYQVKLNLYSKLLPL